MGLEFTPLNGSMAKAVKEDWVAGEFLGRHKRLCPWIEWHVLTLTVSFATVSFNEGIFLRNGCSAMGFASKIKETMLAACFTP